MIEPLHTLYLYPHWQNGPVCEPHRVDPPRPPAYGPASTEKRSHVSLSLTYAMLRYSYNAPHLWGTQTHG